MVDNYVISGVREMVNSKLLKCCPGCGSNDDRNWIFAKKVSLGATWDQESESFIKFWLIFSQERKQSLRYRSKKNHSMKNQLKRNRLRWNQFHLPNMHLNRIFLKCLEVSAVIEPGPVIFRSSLNLNINNNF